MNRPTAGDIVKKVCAGGLKPAQVLDEFYARIDRLESTYHCYISLCKDYAYRQAQELEKRLRTTTESRGRAVGAHAVSSGLGAAPEPLLAGVPLAVKDNMCIEGVRTTCGSKILENYIAPYDATIVRRLKGAGALLIAKANMDEFAMGSSTENSAYLATRNPWDTACIPGGSSGGSAACVATNEAVLSTGSDTGGSIRQPASCCGVVGMKPTYGRVSRYGLVAFASSLDQIGPFAGCVEDAARLLQVLAGHDPLDSTSVDLPVPDYLDALAKSASNGGIKGLRVGVPKEYFIKGIDPQVEQAVMAAIARMEALGANVMEISLPHTEYALACYYIIAPSEASANLARYDGVKYGYRKEAEDLIATYGASRGEGFGSEVKRRIMLGTYALSSGYYDAYYLKAQRVRTLMRNDFEEAFKQVDIIATPTTPTAAFKIGEKLDDPLQMYLSDVFTIPCNMAGLPGISLPCGFTSDAKPLPIGLQILGKTFDETTVLRAAHAYEQATDWHKRIPPVSV